jgi:Ca-activated chloride channel family protein
MTRLQRLALLCLAAASLAWLNPTRDRVDTGNRQYQAGKYDEAITTYGEVLVDDPESPLLNFNMGTANYKAGKYAEAIASFERVRVSPAEPARQAHTSYNTGNVYYRMGAAAEADKPQEALTAYANALVAYRRALGVDSTDQDAKFNYEFVSKKIADLKKKLEEQQQQQDQQQQQEQQEHPQQQDQQQGDQQEQKEQQQGEPQEQEKAENQEQQQQEQQEQQQAGAQGEEQKPGDEKQAAAAGQGEERQPMSPQEATALIDTARGDELRPDEFVRQLQGGRVAEPAQDW